MDFRDHSTRFGGSMYVRACLRVRE
jgi:hypothetical protein